MCWKTVLFIPIENSTGIKDESIHVTLSSYFPRPPAVYLSFEISIKKKWFGGIDKNCLELSIKKKMV